MFLPAVIQLVFKHKSQPNWMHLQPQGRYYISVTGAGTVLRSFPKHSGAFMVGTKFKDIPIIGNITAHRLVFHSVVPAVAPARATFKHTVVHSVVVAG
jgi:hypothetical protein